MTTKSTVYTTDHSSSVLRTHGWRTAANSAGYLIPHLRPEMTILDVGCGPGSITTDLALLVPQGHATRKATGTQLMDELEKEVNPSSNVAVGELLGQDLQSNRGLLATATSNPSIELRMNHVGVLCLPAGRLQRGTERSTLSPEDSKSTRLLQGRKEWSEQRRRSAHTLLPSSHASYMAGRVYHVFKSSSIDRPGSRLLDEK